MNQLLRSDGPADPSGPTMGFVLLLVAMCSHVGHWMPAIVKSMIVGLALALIARRFDSAAFIKARKFVVTGTVAIDNAVLDDAARRM